MFPANPAAPAPTTFVLISMEPFSYPSFSANAVNSVRRITSIVQGERGQYCPVDVVILASDGEAVIVTFSVVPRVIDPQPESAVMVAIATSMFNFISTPVAKKLLAMGIKLINLWLSMEKTGTWGDINKVWSVAVGSSWFLLGG